MITLQGKGVSDGIAVGRLVFFERSNLVVEKKPITDVAGELERLYAAKRTTSDQLDGLANSMVEKIGKENALLFEIHRMMLDDSDYIDPIIKMIETQKVCAEYAVETCGKRLAQEFADMDDAYMKERAADVDDVSGRLIGVLYGTQKAVGIGEKPVIFASDDFSPSETAQFDRSHVLALVSQQGAANSHTAIFARTMGIPAIIGLGATLAPGFGGKNVALDGETGVLYIEPDAAAITAIEEKRKKLEHKKDSLEKFRGKPTLTKSGKKVKLFANIGSVADVEAVIAGDAEGVGLFRSEFLYLGRSDYPSEDIQYESYRKVVENLQGKQVIIRTLDIGADKQVEYFALPHEENPALGMRAIRICLTRPELFETQLRAIYRASAYGNAAIMFPMISDITELHRAKKIAAGVREKLAAENIPFNPETPIGIMIETPASAMISDLLAKEADFFSIGTNDLTQYTLAIDRQNNSLNEFCNTHHEAILRFIRMTTENAHRAGIWCGICGTLGADSELTEKFVNMGIDELSVEPSCILSLRSRIAELA
ncbi:phosphoenolpyruvate--protein phosphotransferase [Treponema primitia]|uniref:phosphoenolpyruvate--protein phosphotransferase n=1 Tax=Treponema primitia TaxID=88058 RepID=UPI0039805C65